MQGARVRSLVRELDPTFMPQLRVCMPQLRSPPTATKTRCNQINKWINKIKQILKKKIGECVICTMHFVYENSIWFLLCMQITWAVQMTGWWDPSRAPPAWRQLMQHCFCPTRLTEPVSLTWLQVNHHFWWFWSSVIEPKSQGLGIKIMHESFLKIPERLQMLGKSTWYFRNLGGKVGWYFYVKPSPSV